jgi:uncharacterized repeat protein (TIGR01451 family)
MSQYAGFCAKLLSACVGLMVCLALSFMPQQSLAQSSACNSNEDLVTFNFGAANATNATGSTRTWATSSLSNTYNVANFGSVGQNTISFLVTAGGGAVIVAPEPELQTQGNVPNSLSYNVDMSAPGDAVTLTIALNRPINKLRFNMYDVDRDNPNWQDQVRVFGFMNAAAVPIAALVPTTPANYVTTTVSTANEITTITNGNCGAGDASCNVQVNFANPVDQVLVVYLAGPAIAAPVRQRTAFNDFAYCVPKRDLRVNKTSSTATFVAGTTSTYLLTVNNRGGATTAGLTTVTDVISAQGVSFVTPQTPVGWTCVLSATTFPADTANCTSSTAIAAGGTTVLTLTVAISPNTTATSATNRAKVYGGGDPNKTLLTSTGPLANCDASNENQSGGGATFFGGVDTTDAGCSFEATPIIRRALLTVNKANSGASLTAGGATSYTITFANLGPSDAPGTVVLDPVSAGLRCSTPTFISTPLTSVTFSPVVLSTTTFQASGVSLTPTFPANSTATFVLACGVTATGLP